MRMLIAGLLVAGSVAGFLMSPVQAAAQAAVPAEKAVLKAELTAREQAIWKAFAANDLATLRKIFAPQFTFVDADGVIDAEALMKFASVCKERSWSFDDPRLISADKTTAVLILHVTQDSECNGKAQDKHIYVTTVWTHQDGEWRQLSHTELPAKN